jgi:hypothetical protein
VLTRRVRAGHHSVAAAVLDPPGLLWTRTDGGHVDRASSLPFLLQPAVTEGREWTDVPAPTALHAFLL